MKYIVVLCDGMADYPSKEWDNATPMTAASLVNIPRLAAKSEIGLVRTVPVGMKPGSDTANLSVMGYDPEKYYTGRSPIEAVSLGVELLDDDVAMRANLVALSDEAEYKDKVMLDYSAGEISTQEAKELIDYLSQQLDLADESLTAGISYRHCFVMHHTEIGTELTPPHDITGKVVGDSLPKGKNAERCLELMKKSYELLSAHPINIKRIQEGKKPANSLWFWGEGTKPALPDFKESFGITGGVVCAVDLIKGIGILAGMEVPYVEGATGNEHTDYSAKAKKAIELLEKVDYVYIHIEAPDECGHKGDFVEKARAIEEIDDKVVGYIVEQLTEKGEHFAMMILPDHPTPVSTMTHASDPVPYLIYDSEQPLDNSYPFSEQGAKDSGNLVEKGPMMIEKLLSHKDKLENVEQQEAPVQDDLNASTAEAEVVVVEQEADESPLANDEQEEIAEADKAGHDTELDNSAEQNTTEDDAPTAIERDECSESADENIEKAPIDDEDTSVDENEVENQSPESDASTDENDTADTADTVDTANTADTDDTAKELHDGSSQAEADESQPETSEPPKSDEYMVIDDASSDPLPLDDSVMSVDGAADCDSMKAAGYTVKKPKSKFAKWCAKHKAIVASVCVVLLLIIGAAVSHFVFTANIIFARSAEDLLSPKKGTEILLKNDITVDGDLIFDKSYDLNLNGYTLTVNGLFGYSAAGDGSVTHIGSKQKFYDVNSYNDEGRLVCQQFSYDNNLDTLQIYAPILIDNTTDSTFEATAAKIEINGEVSASSNLLATLSSMDIVINGALKGDIVLSEASVLSVKGAVYDIAGGSKITLLAGATAGNIDLTTKVYVHKGSHYSSIINSDVLFVEQLATPHEVIVEQEGVKVIITAMQVANAYRYIFTLNGGEPQEMTSNVFTTENLLPGRYTVTVKVIGEDREQYLDSKEGSVSFTSSVKLATPTVSIEQREGGIFLIARTVTHASRIIYTIDGVSYESTLDEAADTVIDITEKVAAIGEHSIVSYYGSADGAAYIDSEKVMNTYITYKKLDTPMLSYDDTQEGIAVIEWGKIENARGYHVSVVTANGAYELIINDSAYTLTLEETVSYVVNVKALGSGYYTDSNTAVVNIGE